MNLTGVIRLLVCFQRPECSETSAEASPDCSLSLVVEQRISPSSRELKSYLLLNYQGKTRDVMTLAHELGHGVHQVLAGAQGHLMADTPLTLEEITHLQAGKTGALIEWAAISGAVMAGADTGPLSAYAGALGLAFQIQDDVIDVTGSAEAVGKAVGKDAAAGKATFVSLLGLDAAITRAQTLVDAACDALSLYGDDAETLRQIARFVIARKS